MPERRAEVEAYVAKSKLESEIERTSTAKAKTGVFIGAYATNPVNDEPIPIWIADYVLMGYGTGAIMAVPAHDQRDFEFARQFGLPIKLVVQPAGQHISADELTEAWPEEGVMVNSGPLDGVPAGKGAGESVKTAIAWLEERGKGKGTINYRLRDWLISRQRYWGTPIPMIHRQDGSIVPVPEEQLPVVLPEIEDYLPKGRSPLASADAVGQCRRPRNRRSGAARHRHDGYVRRFVVVLSCATPMRRTPRRSSRKRRRRAGCRSISISAGSSTRFCTCCTRASSPRCCTTMGWCRMTSRSRRCSPRAWFSAASARRLS